MANPLLGSLVDPFTAATLNTVVWNASSGSGVALVARGRVGVSATSSYPALGAAGPYEATGQSLYARATPALAGTGGAVVQTLLKVQQDSSNSAYFVCQPGSLWQAVVLNAGVYTTVNLPAFDPAQHAWWQLTESAGRWLFSVSADGAAWTQVASIAYSWSPHAVQVYFVAGSSTVTGQTAYFEHVNTPLGATSLMPSWPQIRFQIAFNTGGNQSTPPAFVDLSSRLRGSWSADLSGRQYELDQIQSGQLSLTLWNLDGALDPLNVASPYAPNVVPMRQCRLQAVWPPTRNLIPQNLSSGTAPASAWYAYTGSVSVATGVAAAPTGHTTALAWQFPVTASNANQFPLLTGTTGGGAEATSFPVVAGQAYSFSCWLSRSSGGDATVGVTQDILWYDKTGAQISGTGGTLASIPVQGAWGQNTISGTAPTGAVEARIGTWLANTSTTAVNTLYLTGMQLEQAAAPTPWTAGGVIYPLWAGFVERFPQQWNYSGTYGLVDLTCIDPLAGLAQFMLQPNFSAQVQSLGPQFTYPFNEASGATRFADATGSRPPRVATVSPLGAGGASITAGNSVQGTGSVGSAGPVVALTNPNYGKAGPSAGMYLDCTRLEAPPTSGGWTRLIAFRTGTVPPSGSEMCLWASSGPGVFVFGSGYSVAGSQGLAGLYINAAGHVYGATSDYSGTNTTSITVPDVTVTDGNWHVAALKMSADGKTITVVCDGYYYAQAYSSGDYHPTGITADTIGCVANASVGAYNLYYQGDLAYAVQIPSDVPTTTLLDLASGFSTGWAGEYSGARMGRILGLAGYTGLYGYQGSLLRMGGANIAGTDAMSALTLVGDTEAGQIFADAAGVVWMTGRLWRYLQPTATVTFGENAGEVPYLGDIAVDYDTTHIYNVAQVQQVLAPGAAQPPQQIANNVSSQQQYLPRTVQRSINTYDQTLTLAAAQYLTSQYAQPLPRLAALNVDPASNPALWSTVLPLAFGTRAQVNRRPPAGPGATQISVQQFIEHLSWSGDDQGNLKLSLQLTPASPYLNWGIAAPMHTTVAVASAAGTATVTLGALTGSTNNPAAAVLPAGTQLTLGYGGANAETLIVKSVAATSPGYSSVAVTFTTNTANSHAIGETVCQPLPGGYNLPAATAAGYPASLDGTVTLSSAGPRAAF